MILLPNFLKYCAYFTIIDHFFVIVDVDLMVTLIVEEVVVVGGVGGDDGRHVADLVGVDEHIGGGKLIAAETDASGVGREVSGVGSVRGRMGGEVGRRRTRRRGGREGEVKGDLLELFFVDDEGVVED